MSRQIQIRRGTANEHNNFTGAPGEITMDTTNKTLCVHDGSTKGGTKLINENYSGLLDKKITNCILEIPQDIKLELASDGKLTLKAGSKVYIPNGVGVFDVVNTESNYTLGTVSGITGQCSIYFNKSGNKLQLYYSNTDGSGEQDPSGSMTFYNTTENIIKRFDAGSLTLSRLSLPLAHITVSSGKITNINQVFNGFGFIGNSIFALPNVKGLIPDGRNPDGTLKNTEFTTSGVVVKTFSSSFSGLYNIFLNNNVWETLKNTYSYDYACNYNMNDTSVYNNLYMCDLQLVSGRISSINFKSAFRTVDYDDYKQLKGLDSNIDFFVEKGTNYMKLKSGTILCSGNANVGLVTLPKAFANTQYIVVLGASGASCSNKTTTSFQMNGERSDWFAIGMGA